MIFSFANEPKTISIEENFSSVHTSGNMYYFLDESNSLSIDKIYKDKGSLFSGQYKKNYALTKGSLWVWIKLNNPQVKSTTIILENPYSGIDYMDTHVFVNNTFKYLEKLGDANPQALHKFLYATSVSHINLNSKDSIDILIKYQSQGFVKSNTIIHSGINFISDALFSSRVYSFIFGVLIALLLYNVAVYVTIKEKVFLYYVLYGISNILIIATTNGFLYELNIGLYGDILRTIGTLGANGSAIFLLLLISSLFDLKKNALKLYNLNKIFVMLFIFLSITHIILSLIPQVYEVYSFTHNKILHYSTIAVSLLLVFNTIYGVYKRYDGSVYLFFGLVLYLSSINVFLLYLSGSLTYTFFNSHANALGITGDMLFVFISLSKKLSNLKDEENKAKALLYERSRFTSIGNVLAGVIHQLKNPLSYIGTTITYFETKERMNNTLTTNDEKIFLNLNRVNQEINTIVKDVNTLFIKESKPTPYIPKKTIEPSE